jgi:hypothetical protein
VVVIVWQLYLQPPMQSVLITSEAMSSNTAYGDMYSIQHYTCMALVVGRYEGLFTRRSLEDDFWG